MHTGGWARWKTEIPASLSVWPQRRTCPSCLPPNLPRRRSSPKRWRQSPTRSRRPERGTGPGKEEPLAGDRDATDFQQMQQTNSVYGSQELRIEAQDILDGTGKSVRCFTTGDTLRFQIQLAAHKAVRHFVAVVCIMTRSGKTVTQLFCTSEDLGISSIPENGHVTIGAELSPLRIGEGEYMVSIGIFKQCTMSKAAEEPSYCVSDRALFFKVEQPFGVKKGLGDLLHPCNWSCGAVHPCL